MHTLLEAGLKAGISVCANQAIKAATSSKSGKIQFVSEDVKELRRKIECERSEIQSNFTRIAKKDLLSSVSYYNEGISYLYEAFGNMKITDEKSKELKTALQTGGKEAEVNVELCLQSFTVCLEKISLNWRHFDETTIRCLLNAKERFKDARKKATEAFNLDILSTSQIIMALRYRVFATILENIDHPIDAIPACKFCLEELHSLPCVKNRFKDFQDVVHHLNRIVCEVAQAFGSRGALLSWPIVVVKDKKIDPRMVYCGLTIWSFGQEGNDSEKLKLAWNIASNSLGELIVADSEDRNVKIFDGRGKFLYFLFPFADASNSECHEDEITEIWNVATDMEDNVLVLGHKKSPGNYPTEVSLVYVYSKSMDLAHSFALSEGFRGSSLAVDDNNQVFITGGEFAKFHKNNLVRVYTEDGRYVECFGEGILVHALDICAANGGQVIVLDRDAGMLLFNAVFEPLCQFVVGKDFGAIAFHPVTENIFVASASKTCPKVLVYSKDGKKEREIEFAKEAVPIITGMTVTSQGRIAVTGNDLVLFV